MRKISKSKSSGQVFTPGGIAIQMLSAIGYTAYSDVDEKLVLDNSCGDGAILAEAVVEKIRYTRLIYHDLDKTTLDAAICKSLERDIHGIELDPELCEQCKMRLDGVLDEHNVSGKVNWDIRNEDALLCHDFDGKVDFLCCNPPYVRVHNLAGRDKYEGYSFAKDGMTDLYIMFFELGFRQLSPNGRMAYITPNSWFTSVAGRELRKHVVDNSLLKSIYNFGHEQVFSNATTYVAISTFDNRRISNGVIDYAYTFFEDGASGVCISNPTYDDISFGDDMKFLFPRDGFGERFREIYDFKCDKPKVRVKNGFATLADDVFIADSENDFGFSSKRAITVVKSTTLERQVCLFPYDKEYGRKIPVNDLFADEDYANYFERNRDKLLKGKTVYENADWMYFGRTQGLNDIGKRKIAVSTLMSESGKIKFSDVAPGEGVYGGLYITCEDDSLFDRVKSALSEDNGDLREYVKTIGKCKSGGYYTFSSKDLERFLNWSVSKN